MKLTTGNLLLSGYREHSVPVSITVIDFFKRNFPKVSYSIPGVCNEEKNISGLNHKHSFNQDLITSMLRLFSIPQ